MTGGGTAGGVGVAIDGHVHFHRCFDAARFLDAARAHLAATAAPGVLMLTEGHGERAFVRLADGLVSGAVDGWASRETAESTSLAAVDREGRVLTLVAGRQIATREGIEVLALNTTAVVPDLGSLEDTLEAVWSRGSVAVIPWGFGKWWGRRGRRVRDALEAHRSRPLMLGDNAGRPRGLGEPALFGVARELGVGILPGSDPLPFASEVGKVGRRGCVLAAGLDPDRPGASVVGALSTRAADLAPFGSGERWPRFVALQLAMQGRKRLGRVTP